jgi:EamA domain-containing membrane protein RarD
LAKEGITVIIPLNFKAVAGIAPVEVLAHRALWSFVMLGVLVICWGGGGNR